METRIRNLKKNDFKRLAKFYYSFYDELDANPKMTLLFEEKKPQSQFRNTFNWFYRSMLKKDTIFKVLEDKNGNIVGQCNVIRVWPHSEINHIGELNISLLPEYRGKGIGKLLLSKCLGECKGRFEMVLVRVFSINKAAKELYRKFGFKKYGTLSAYVKRGKKYYDNDFMYLKI